MGGNCGFIGEGFYNGQQETHCFQKIPYAMATGGNGAARDTGAGDPEPDGLRQDQ